VNLINEDGIQSFPDRNTLKKFRSELKHQNFFTPITTLSFDVQKQLKSVLTTLLALAERLRHTRALLSLRMVLPSQTSILTLSTPSSQSPIPASEWSMSVQPNISIFSKSEFARKTNLKRAANSWSLPDTLFITFDVARFFIYIVKASTPALTAWTDVQSRDCDSFENVSFINQLFEIAMISLSSQTFNE
jgi:hypothetical protein